MKEIILLGGAAGAGKTALAKQLSEHFSIPWISTDQVRTIRGLQEPDEDKQAAVLWESISAFIRAPHPWEGGIIEGIAIMPQLVSKHVTDGSSVRILFLIQENREDIAHVIAQRSLLPWIKTKTPEEQEAKIERLVLQNEEIKKSAEELGFTCIVGGKENTLQEALRALQ